MCLLPCRLQCQGLRQLLQGLHLLGWWQRRLPLLHVSGNSSISSCRCTWKASLARAGRLLQSLLNSSYSTRSSHSLGLRLVLCCIRISNCHA